MIAELDGFQSTAEALRQIAIFCCLDADVSNRCKRIEPEPKEATMKDSVAQIGLGSGLVLVS